jgi:hypothetical protein
MRTLLNIMKRGSIEYRKELMLVLLRITRVTGIRYSSSAQVFCNKYTDSNLEACFRGAVMRIIQENHEITLFTVCLVFELFNHSVANWERNISRR